ncbi:Disintegrin and metalloproteinase domain-containing protein 2 [Heterocephalus glaber]|uniref:Disintegrin and metalloproteinase domain-containing protein 2 n=1 Tax=Heterocephalus glaber TaxID=10181 RepID=G5BY91_HETGA|nr:Disintegrin and metalloproteinase domain-containing protein 2 [Heterocephalus glaber]
MLSVLLLLSGLRALGEPLTNGEYEDSSFELPAAAVCPGSASLYPTPGKLPPLGPRSWGHHVASFCRPSTSPPSSEFFQYIELHLIVEKDLHPKSMNLDSFAVILVQLLSLSMGITYDDVNRCHCPGAVCVMNPEAIHSGGVKIFSDCSMNDFARFTSKPMSQCLQNQPRLQTAYQGTTCGNKIVEAGETCDCGTEEFKSSEEICRNRVDECDLPEFCNGSSADCQEDLFILNGHPCGENKWICMNGKCVSGKTQCEAAFGEGIYDHLIFYVCRNKECVADSFLGYDCTPATCNNNGVCNNKKACQCYPGYLPPDCSIKIPVYGAQFDPERHYIKGVYQTKPKNWPFLLIIPFLIIFSVLIAIVVKVYFQRKKWRTEDYISEEYVDFVFKFYYFYNFWYNNLLIASW